MTNNPNAPVPVKSKNNKLTSAKLQRKRSGAPKRREMREAEEVWAPSTHRGRRAVFDLAQETREPAEDVSETSSITHESTDKSVNFAMFLGDVKRSLFDMSDKTHQTKSTEPETAETVNCVDLLTSAKEIGTVTKDVVVEETMGCAAWSFAAFLAGLGHATGVNQPVKAETNDQQQTAVDPVKVEGLSLLAEQILAEHMQAAKGPPTEAGDSISMLTDDDLPNHSTGPKSYDDRSCPSSPSKGMSTKSMAEKTNADQRSLSTKSNGMSTMSTTEKSNADMKEHLRQIKELNAEMERLLARGDPVDVDLANVLRHRSKVLCKGMATKTGRAAKVVGKSSKKGFGSALISTSKAMGSMGEKLAKSKQNDVTHTTGESSTLSSRGRSHSRSRPTSSCSRSRSQSRSRSVQSNISASKGLKKTRRPMITPTTGDNALSSRSRSRPTSSSSRGRSRPNPMNPFEQQDNSKFTDEMFSALSVAASREKSLLH